MPVEPGFVKDNNSDQATNASQNVELAQFPNKNINRRIAVGSTVAAAGLFLSTRLDFGVSLKSLSATAIPYEEVSSSVMVSFHLYMFHLFRISLEHVAQHNFVCRMISRNFISFKKWASIYTF